MSGPLTKPNLPKCKDCGKRTDRVVSDGPIRHIFLCADCEYLRAKPDAPRFIKPPRDSTSLYSRPPRDRGKAAPYMGWPRL